MDFLIWLEDSGVGTWVRESPSSQAFPGIIVFHAIGMAFLAGTNVIINLRILGFAPGIPLSKMEKFFPVMWFGLVVNAASGILLTLGYPLKAFTNPVFYFKLCCIVAGVALTLWIRRQIIRNPAANFLPILLQGKVLAVVSLAVWAAAITSGRFLAYTCRQLLQGLPC